MSDLPTKQAASQRLSCYLLEFSVGGGGSRQADVHAHVDLAGLRAGFDRHHVHRYRGEAASQAAYLLLCNGALLHLWVVRHGLITEGVDLHPFLRTGDRRMDRAVARVLDTNQRVNTRRPRAGRAQRAEGEFFQRIWELYDFDTLDALPLFAHLFDLRDRAGSGDERAVDELAALTASIDEGSRPRLPDGVAVTALTLDWDAIAAAVPPLRTPLLEPDTTTTVGWSRTCPRHRESRLPPSLGIEPDHRFHLGLNDLEGGHDEYLPAKAPDHGSH